MKTEFIILVIVAMTAFFGISLFMMNRVLKGLADFYLKQKQDFISNTQKEGVLESHDDKGYTPLMVALENKWVNLVPELVGRILENDNALIIFNHSNSAGVSALLLAVETDDIPTLDLLLASGVDVNKIHKPKGDTALQHACLMLKPVVVEFLLKNGADVLLKTEYGNSVREAFLKEFGNRVEKEESVHAKVFRLIDGV
jgi:hypothetical protein